jgi:hypothetical protein
MLFMLHLDLLCQQSSLTIHPVHTKAMNGVPNTFPLTASNLTPSFRSSVRFSCSVIPSPSRRAILPLNPPSVPPVATTR